MLYHVSHDTDNGIAYCCVVWPDTALLIPMVNEAFGERFSDRARVILLSNERLFTSRDGKTEKRISDANFSVEDVVPGADAEAAADALFRDGLLGSGFDIEEGTVRKHYIFECESKPVTGKILVRIVEYAVKTGIDTETVVEDGAITISIPQAAVLSLESTRNTPSRLRITIRTSEGQIDSIVPVIKLSDYTVDDIFEKELYILIPFFLFNRKKQFEEIQGDEEKYKALLDEVCGMYERVDAQIPADENESALIDVFTSKALRAVGLTVLEGVAANFPVIVEGVKKAMGGKIIEFDALRIKREGMREGMRKGMHEGAAGAFTQAAERMIRGGYDGKAIATVTGYDRGQIDSIARRMNRTVNWGDIGA